MLSYNDLLKKYEDNHFYENTLIYDKLISEICNDLNISLPCDVSKLDYMKRLNIYLKFIKINLRENPNYVNYLYDIYNKYDYFVNEEIKDAMKKLKQFDKYDKDIINKILYSPIIDDVINNELSYTLITRNVGKIKVERAYPIFNDNPFIKNYIKLNQTSNRCHENSMIVSKYDNNIKSAVSMCKLYFKGNYFHSYNICDDKVIDLCYNSIIDRKKYEKLFSSTVLKEVYYDEIESLCKIADENYIDNGYLPLIKIGLYERHKMR